MSDSKNYNKEVAARPTRFLAWAVQTFGAVALRRDERAARFVEEALEVGYAEGLDAALVRRLMKRVYSRPPGDLAREVGQAQATLECLAENVGIDAGAEADRELERVRLVAKEEWLRRQAAKAAQGVATPVEGELQLRVVAAEDRCVSAERKVQRLRRALAEIRDHWACQYDHPMKQGPMYAGSYGIGVTDGHRLASLMARIALEDK